MPGPRVIYSVTHTETGWRYIGRASDFKLRKNRHHCRFLQRAWEKHGEKAFSFEVIEVIAPNVDIIAREQFWLDSISDKYNCHHDAKGPVGYRHTEATKAKLSALLKGRKHSEEALRNIRLGMLTRRNPPPRYGRPTSANAKAKTAAANSVTRTLLSPDGVVIIITNLSDFARKNGLVKSGLSAISLGRVPQYKGWRLP